MSSYSTSPTPTVKLAQGTVVGTTLVNGNLPDIEAFRGIPYAIPPIGDRRFRAPIPVPPSDDTIDASKFGHVAPGKPLFHGGPAYEYSEDCLTANVFRTRRSQKEDSELWPVAVYFHAGAFNRGTSSMYNAPSFLAHSGQRLIVVTFNYRIGALGFLPSTLSAEEGVLNLGLKDQALLMEWVKDNIGAFGGDANNVALYGLSAGAHSDPQKSPLYHRVIMESGAPTSRAVRPYNAPTHEQQFSDFLREVGCPLGLSSKDTFAFLRQAPTEVIQAAQIKVFNNYNPSLSWAFQPVIDGEMIPRPPIESWRLNKWRKVPIMTGFTRNEGSIYISKSVSESSQFTQFFAELLPLLSSEDIETIRNLYPDPLEYKDSPYNEQLKGTGAQYRRLEAAYGHYAYVAPARQTAELASTSMGKPVYLYQWALESTKLDGARHGDNMYYESCEPSKTNISESQKQLALDVNSRIASFLVSGDPNTHFTQDGPKWERYDVRQPKAMVFGLENKELVGGKPGPSSVLMDDDWARKESEFWWSKVDISQQ
ncbi:similar to lipase [Plenodomus lingam JN3]|uniref:Carboxylic ester hydrolase n=1 Tax=Leptosphaeria maculans (strain JN3 / isolate v23.1.3 / race Av1-4-5-6-7-8) TaxID=985895 RepID=E4ZVU7_LEPMJ|nr:similar to lipase [Plenodomus lingam JN3]CBX95723.1 similar to lipase [Plenodomus lingam JN3]